MLAGFPEGRIVPCLCAEGTRTLCPQGESRRAQIAMSSGDIAEMNGIQLVQFQQDTEKPFKFHMKFKLSFRQALVTFRRSPLPVWACCRSPIAGFQSAFRGQKPCSAGKI